MTKTKEVTNPYSELQPSGWPKAEVSVWINRPAEQVFEFVSNYNNDTRWRQRVIKMTQSPADAIGVGTITHEEMNFLGRRYITIAQVTALEPNKRLEWASVEATTPVSGWRMVEPEGQGARFTQVIAANLQGFYRWLSPVMIGTFKKQMTQDMTRLKQILEQDIM